MSPTSGFYQPIDPIHQIIWLWWAILTMFGVVCSSEMMYQWHLGWILYLVVLIGIALFNLLRRRMLLTDNKLFMSYSFRRDVDELALQGGDLQWQIKQHRLTIRKGNRIHAYWVSRTLARQLQDMQADANQ